MSTLTLALISDNATSKCRKSVVKVSQTLRCRFTFILNVALTATMHALPVRSLKSQLPVRKIIVILAAITAAVNAEEKLMSSGPRCRYDAIIICMQTVLHSHLRVRDVAAADVPSVTTARHHAERAER